MLLELQRQKLEALRMSAGAPTGYNVPQQVQGEGRSQPSISARQTVLHQSNGSSVPASDGPKMGKGDES